MVQTKEKINCYFGKLKDGTIPKVVEGVNYTPETLIYMTPNVRSVEIMNEIVKRVPSTKRPFNLIETCAGIGGDTITAANNPYISSVITYECEKTRADILINNLKLFDIDYEIVKPEKSYKTNSKVIVNQTFFKGTQTENPYIVYMDPPWVSSSNKKPWKDLTSSDYLYEGIKIGNFTLEQWIDSMKNVQLFVLKLPVGYKLKEESGFVYETIILKDKIQITFVQHNEYYEDKQWYENLQSFIYALLEPVIPDNELRKKYVSNDAMKIWAKAFTHESYDPNNNYEEYEMFGDRLITAQFVDYLLRTEPNIKKDRLSNAVTYYMGRKKQGEYAMELKLLSMMRMYVTETYDNGHIKSDALESFYGALFNVGNSILNGLGYINTATFLDKIFEDKTIDEDIDPPLTFILELFKRLDWGPVIKFIREKGNGFEMELSLPNVAMDYLQQNGIYFESHLLARERGSTKKAVKEMTYLKAFKKLREKGITRNWLDTHHEALDFQMIPKPMFNELKSILKEYKLLKLVEHPEVDRITLQLVVIKKNKQKELLETLITDKNPARRNQDRIELIKKYLDRIK